jgi:hypothetical protein
MIPREHENIKEKIAWMAKYLDDENFNRIGDLSVIKEIKGEFEYLLKAILECTQKDDYEVACIFATSLLGAFWENMFCEQFAYIPGSAKTKKGVHRFQKWQRLGPGRLADGVDELRHTAVLPDVLFTIYGQWVFAEIKNETPTTEEHKNAPPDCYGMSLKDYERAKELGKIERPIPIWFIVHDHSRQGKWSIENESIDWRAGNFAKLGAPIEGEGAKAVTSWKKEPERRAYWSKDKFDNLVDALESLKPSKGG